jgi:hypothetical protein
MVGPGRLHRAVAACLFLIAAALPGRLAFGHDIPDEIAVTGFVKPGSDHTDVLLRVPLTLLADLDLPKVGPGYLDWSRLGPLLRIAANATARAIALHDGDQALDGTIAGTRISLPSDRAFQRYEEALALIHGPALPADELVYHNQGFFDVHLIYPPAQDMAVRVNLAPGLGDRLHLGLRVIAPDGAVRAYELRGGRAEFRLDPRWHQAALMFVADGIGHILTGIDHLLFLLCLVVPFRRRVPALIGVVTAFTVGHSITLALAALGAISAGRWFPPVVETLIAVTILYMAIENVLWARLARRWLIAAGFGLIHGFGFANALGETLQFAGGHLALSLLAFNFGIEAGQIAALCLIVPALNLLFRMAALRRWGVLLISILAGHEAWHWMIERAGQIKLADLQAIDPASAQTALAWAATAGLALVLGWPLAMRLLQRVRRAS